MSKPIEGIAGVMGAYVSIPQSLPSREVSEKMTDPTATNDKSTPKRKSSRLGRPPGKAGGESKPKQKTTLRIDVDLMIEYREWTWEARCQLGELVELALIEYRNRHHRAV